MTRNIRILIALVADPGDCWAGIGRRLAAAAPGCQAGWNQHAAPARAAYRSFSTARLMAGFLPADLEKLELVSFVDAEEGKTQDGWLLRDILLLYLEPEQLQDRRKSPSPAPAGTNRRR